MKHKPVKVIHCNLCEEKFEHEDNVRDHYDKEHDTWIPYDIIMTVEWV